MARAITRCGSVACVAVTVIAGSASPASARQCSSFRPDVRYGDVVQNLRATGVSCSAAKRKLRTFYDYDRDKGKYRPITLAGFRCRQAWRSGEESYIGDGSCTRGRLRIRWVFVTYTG